MAKADRLLGRVAAAGRRRFGSPAARFRFAVSSGFVIAAVGLATVTVGQSGQAQDFLGGGFGGLAALFGLPQTVQQQAARPHRAEEAGRRFRTADDARRTHRARSGASGVEPRHRLEAALKDAAAPMRLGRASICVRGCDGFAFPVGDFHGQGDIAAHESTCRAQCPGARTTLYVLPTGSSSIDEAVEARSGQAYSRKASGFHYTTYLDERCSCHPASGNRVASLLHDYTLRRGDAVVTAGGIRVFHGGERFPFRQADFVRLAQSRDVRAASRATFRDIEKAGLTTSHPAVAEAARPAPAASLKGLEHQAAAQP